MAASERIQNRRSQCIFRLAFQHCPLRKLARKIRGGNKNTYNIPAEPSQSLADRWRSFNAISGNLPPPQRNAFNQAGAGSAPPYVLPRSSVQILPQGSQAPALPLRQVQVELNQEPTVSSVDMEVDPETGERAQS